MGDDEDLMRQIARAGGHLDPGLSDRDVERMVAGGARRRQRRATRRKAMFASAAAACLIVAGVLVVHRTNRQSRQDEAQIVESAPPRPSDRILRLADGSTAAPLDAETEIELVEQHPDRVALSLVRGRGRFEVTPQSKRTFVVRAGDVTVAVVGTAFTVERVADRVGVAVQRGTVRVEWGTGSALVTAGESGWYPPLTTTASVDRAPAPAPKVARAPRAHGAASTPARDDPGEAAAALLMAADRARLAGHADQGAELLRQLVREHPADPRAPLAAFTLGRLLLMELGRPADAATAFAEARRLSANGAFAEDALAREVEALGKAGRAAEAQARADEYRRLYPNGRRMATVRTAGSSP